MNSTTGKLITSNVNEGSSGDWKLSAVELFKTGRINDARKLMCGQARPEEMEDVFRWCYDNLELWGKTQEQQDKAIIIIRNGYANMPLVADQEINLSATLTELTNL